MILLFIGHTCNSCNDYDGNRVPFSKIFFCGLQTACHLNLVTTNKVDVIISILPMRNGVRRDYMNFKCCMASHCFKILALGSVLKKFIM